MYLLPPDPDLYVSDPRLIKRLGNETENPDCFLYLMTWLGILTLEYHFDIVSNTTQHEGFYRIKLMIQKNSWQIFAQFYRSWGKLGRQTQHAT